MAGGNTMDWNGSAMFMRSFVRIVPWGIISCLFVTEWLPWWSDGWPEPIRELWVMSIWTIISMNIPFDSIVELPGSAENCSTGSSSRLSPQSQEHMMDLSRAYGQLVRENTIYSGYASQGDTPITIFTKSLQCFKFCKKLFLLQSKQEYPNPCAWVSLDDTFMFIWWNDIY